MKAGMSILAYLNVYLALHRQWDIEIDFSVSEGTFFPYIFLELFLLELFLITCDSDQASISISTFLSVGLRVRIESISGLVPLWTQPGPKETFQGLT